MNSTAVSDCVIAAPRVRRRRHAIAVRTNVGARMQSNNTASPGAQIAVPRSTAINATAARNEARLNRTAGSGHHRRSSADLGAATLPTTIWHRHPRHGALAGPDRRVKVMVESK